MANTYHAAIAVFCFKNIMSIFAAWNIQMHRRENKLRQQILKPNKLEIAHKASILKNVVINYCEFGKVISKAEITT